MNQENNGNRDPVTGKVRSEVEKALQNNGLRKLAEREIEQVHVLSKWTLGIISALLLLGASWLWQISSSMNTIERNLDRYVTAFQAQEPTLSHLRQHADKVELDIQRITQENVQTEKRVSTLEAGAALGARFTKQDGDNERMMREKIDEVINERITILEKRIAKLEDENPTRKK